VCLLLSLLLADTPHWCPREEVVEMPSVLEEAMWPQLIGGVGDKGGKKPTDPNKPKAGASGKRRARIYTSPRGPLHWSFCNRDGSYMGPDFFDFDTFCGCTSSDQCDNSWALAMAISSAL